MDAPRCFAVSPSGETAILSVEEATALIGCPPSVSAAYDLLTDSGMSPDKAAELAVAAYRSGRDPEAFARHVARVRRQAQAR